MRGLIATFLVFLSASSVFADGGTLRVSRVAGPWRVSMFTSPTPLRAGTIDVSLLVQDAKTGQVRLGVPVRVRARRDDREVEGLATHEQATNKLLQAAHLDLDQSGRWSLLVVVEGVEVEADVELAGPAASWRALAPWVGWPFVVVALFVLHRRRASRSFSSLSPGTGGADVVESIREERPCRHPTEDGHVHASRTADPRG